MSAQEPPPMPRATRSKRPPPHSMPPLTSQPTLPPDYWTPKPMYTYPLYQPTHTVYPPTLSANVTPEAGDHLTPEGASHFTMYPASLPSNPYYQPQYIHWEPEATSETKQKSKATKTPRPPNAWILYRSDMLKAIANGESIPGLDSVVNESGVSGSSEGEEPKEGKRIKAKKPRKGAKEPSQGILSLGKGKTGRGLPQADISKMISLLWKKEKPEARAKYERLAEIKKQEHQARYPGYKFQPLRRADKLKLREEKEREKDAARREKEALGKTRRRPRTRPPPVSPYLPRLHDGADVPTWAEPKQLEMRSYPFPMPMAALPAIATEPFPTYEIPCVVEPRLGYDEARDAESLAAMWCLLEDESPEAGPSDTHAWQVDGNLASEQWNHFAVGPDAVYGNLELSSAVAAQIAAEWDQDVTAGFVTVGYNNPALPTVQLSPVGGWIPDNLLHQTADNRISSGSSVSSEQAKTPVASRYVSSSAYPAMEPDEQGARVVSFSAFAVESDLVESPSETEAVVPKPRAERGRAVGRSYSEES